MNLLRISLTIAGLMFCFYSTGQLSFDVPDDNPVELGKVNWLRNYDEAIQLSKEKGLPVFLLFQEVPGCSTCSTYGNEVLSHPFIVEAIESHFIPLVIYNNKGGHDANILKLYKEPSWNNPVARIIDEKGKNLVNRLSGNYSQLGALDLIINGLVKSNQITPRYLQLYQEELLLSASKTEEISLSMFCFWTGEKEIGNIPGVFKTAAGFMHGQEVVNVTYDPNVLSEKELIKKAAKNRCADKVYTDKNSIYQSASKIVGKQNVSNTSKFRYDKDQKYYLKKSEYASIPMTDYQSMKVNSLIGAGQNPSEMLSPRQLEISKSNLSTKTSKDLSFLKKWYELLGAE